MCPLRASLCESEELVLGALRWYWKILQVTVGSRGMDIKLPITVCGKAFGAYYIFFEANVNI